MINPDIIGWYLTSAKNISMFVQLKDLFVRRIEIKRGYPKEGKNTHRTWVSAVRAKLEAEAILEDARIHNNAAFRSGENQYFFQAMIVYVSSAVLSSNIANLC